MTAFAGLRYPVSLLVAVSASIGFVWYALGIPVQMPPSPVSAGEKLNCVSYAPSTRGDGGTELSASRIEADIAALAPHTACIRTYRTGAGLDRIPEIAGRHKLTVLQGIAVGRNNDENRAEIERAVSLAQSRRATIRAFIVGSEVLSRGEISAFDLTALIREVRGRTKMPVSYADRSEVWLGGNLLAAGLDFITVHVPMYDAVFPVPPGDAARHVAAVHAKVAARYPGKEILIGEAGWPSAGPMREAALPSPANQARVIHDLTAAAKTGKFQLNLFEGIDRETGGGPRPAAIHWGLLRSDSREAKFNWGEPISNHPLWRMQAAIGILLALVVFASGFLSARSVRPDVPVAAPWTPIALIALSAGTFVGRTVAELPVQDGSTGEWISAAILMTLACLVPPVVAAAVIRRLPFEGFSAILDPAVRNSVNLLGRAVTLLFILTVLAALQMALVLLFDPEGRQFPFAALTGPAVSLLILSIANARGPRRESYAEAGAALVLAIAGAMIVFNESFWNWQALWFAAVLWALAAACWRAPAAQRR